MGRVEHHERHAASRNESAAAASPDLSPPRVILGEIWPTVDGGRYDVKRVVGERLDVRAKLFADAHDRLDALLCFRPTSSAAWRETGLVPSTRGPLELLLRIFLIDKSTYELGYELDNRPTWTPIPLRGIRELLDREGL